MARKIVVIGWDGRSNPMYRYYDQLGKSDHMRDKPTVTEVVEQFPEARYTRADYSVIDLKDLVPSSNG